MPRGVAASTAPVAAYEDSSGGGGYEAAPGRTPARLELNYTTVRSPISGRPSSAMSTWVLLVGPGGKSLLATIVQRTFVAHRFQYDIA